MLAFTVQWMRVSSTQSWQANDPIADGPITDGPITDGPIADGPIADGPIKDDPITDDTLCTCLLCEKLHRRQVQKMSGVQLASGVQNIPYVQYILCSIGI